MAKYSSASSSPVRNRGVIQTTNEVLPTHEGGKGYARTPRSELFLTLVNEMAEDTFYESAEQRRHRIATLIAQVLTETDGQAWLSGLSVWLRQTANMRSAPVMLLAEMAAAGAKGLRPLVPATLARADEPGELLGYWLQFHGRKIPAGLKRGIADAAVKLYTERNTLKYDGQSKGVRFADVVELTHPCPSAGEQSALFKHLIDRRHNRGDLDLRGLPTIATDAALQSLSQEERRANLSDAVAAGWSWERLAGWLTGGMDAEAWEAVIPSMGYMALLRNLRNFDQAGISGAAQKAVTERLADRAEVERSRQFPYRFLSAYQATDSLNWAPALESALNSSVNNVPAFPGRTLVLVDTSGSMQSSVGGARSQAQRYEVAALFGATLALRNPGQVDLAIYATGVAPMQVSKGGSILRSVQAMQRRLGEVGHGTNTWQAIRSQYNNHDRVVVLTDEQSHDHGENPGAWLHFINLAGYRVATAPQDRRTFAYGGFTDSMFSLLPLMERGVAGRWPWEA